MRRTHTGGLLFFTCAALLASLSSPHARAQEVAAAPAQEENVEDAPWQARKLDEFGQVRGCDHGARLDNLATELLNRPDLTAYVVAYGPSGEGSGTADFRLQVTRDYLVMTRGLLADRIKLVNGGAYKDKHQSWVELWVAPPGAEPPPPPRKFENDAATFAGLYSEFETWDISGMTGEALGPPVGNSNLAGFAEVLRLQPSARAYIVAFNGEESAFHAWRRVADREIEQLKRRYGVKDDRVSVIFGGQEKELKLQLWVLPPDAPPPAEDAGRERRPAKATMLGPFEGYLLKYPDEARTFFKAFAEALKADEEMTISLAVYLPSSSSPEEEEATEESGESPREEESDESPPATDAATDAAPDPEEPPEVDLVQLVEKWRGDLVKEYGIGGQRLVVTFVELEGDVWSSGSISAWLVPPGVLPPDPLAEEEDGTETETEEAASAEGAKPAEADEAKPVPAEHAEEPWKEPPTAPRR
ncbi:MAG TPA: hypothetical protein VF064_08760 [Pyrinomonadaceae bacterium]